MLVRLACSMSKACHGTARPSTMTPVLGVLAVASLLAVLGCMGYARRAVGDRLVVPRAPQRRRPSRYELAYLVGGPRWVVVVAVAELVRTGALTVDARGEVTVTGRTAADPVERAALAAAPSGTWLDVAGGEEVAAIRRTLLRRQLLLAEPVQIPVPALLGMLLAALTAAATFAASLLDGPIWVPVVAGLATIAGAGWLLVNRGRTFRLTAAGYGEITRTEHRSDDADMASHGPDARGVADSRAGLRALASRIAAEQGEPAARSRAEWAGLPHGGLRLGGWLALGGADGISGWRDDQRRAVSRRTAGGPWGGGGGYGWHSGSDGDGGGRGDSGGSGGGGGGDG
jgi:uncharacterized protein (TIGR04222 family)